MSNPTLKNLFDEFVARDATKMEVMAAIYRAVHELGLPSDIEKALVWSFYKDLNRAGGVRGVK